MLLVLLVGACSGDDASPLDASADARTDAVVVGPPSPPAAPAEPEMPVLVPCPEGWTEVPSDDGPTTCEPWPAGEEADCPDDHAQFPGGDGCELIGTPCPTGDFAEDLPSDRPVVYALAGSTGGDGSESSPHGGVGEALDTIADGSVVAVGRGTYDERVVLSSALTLHGACVAETVLTHTAATLADGVVNARGAGAEVRNLRVGPSSLFAVDVTGMGSSLVLQDVLVVDGTRMALAVGPGHLEAHDVLVRGTRQERGDFGRAISVEFGGTASFERAAFLGNGQAPVVLNFGSQLDLDSVVIRDSGDVALDSGRGLVAALSGAATLRASIIERVKDAGVSSMDGATVTIEDSLIRDVIPEVDGTAGRGVEGLLGDVVMTRTTVERVNHVGIGVIDSGTTAMLTDVVVRDTRPRQLDGVDGHGLGVQVDATAMVNRVWLERSLDFGIALEEGAVVQGSDVVVRHVEPEAASGFFGAGVLVNETTALNVQRMRVEDAQLAGIIINAGVGRFTDLSISGIAAATDGSGGRGLALQSESDVEVERAFIGQTREVALFVEGGVSATLSDVAIVDVEERACASTTCPREPAGLGLGVYSSTVELRNFAIEGSPLCGYQLAFGAELDLHQGTVTQSAIGGCVQVDGYDLDRLTDDVLYDGNEQNILTTDLPVPQVGFSGRS